VTPFTLVMAYYENAGMLLAQMKRWCELPADIREGLSVVVIDDGSPVRPALEVCTPLRLTALRSNLEDFQLWRMGVDVRWNQDACRNVGVREAKTSWVLLTDMDHVVPVQTWQRLMKLPLKKSRVYRFGRVSAPALDPYKSHPNSWALTRNVYWQIGGYDEALAGNYGTDGDFLNRARREADLIELSEVLVRYPREVVPDASTTTLERKRPEDRENVNRICKARAADPDWKPLHFSFPCERLV